MEYLTSLQAANAMGVSKRYVNMLCASNKIPNVIREGNRYKIPREYVDSIIRNNSKPGSEMTVNYAAGYMEDAGRYSGINSRYMSSVRENINYRVNGVTDTTGTIKKQFNTTGICDPEKNYMVNISSRIIDVKRYVDEGKYFTINRARQFGKTTTLQALSEYLSDSYYVVSMDFQMQMSDAKYKSENSFSLAFAKAFINSFKTSISYYQNPSAYKEIIDEFEEEYKNCQAEFELVELFQALSKLCHQIENIKYSQALCKKKVVLMIDEVDSATNNQVFLDFLSQLRGYYLNRHRFTTFHSVILAGVCDIKNLKRKMRPDEEHLDNSPWNIAADFDMDMSFSVSQIESMLIEYESDNKTGMDVYDIAREIYDYTAGYPYLVSKLCQIMDTYTDSTGEIIDKTWSHEGILYAVRKLIRENNSLFDDMAKKMKDYPSLKKLIHDILFLGKSIPYNLNTELIAIGDMYGFLKNVDGQAGVANRIFEVWFYNLFIAEEAIDSKTYNEGLISKNQFINGNELNIELILKKFTEHFTEIYGNSTDEFIEESGRKLFILYIRPLINGTGNYYIEARTRSLGRTDLIIDYKGKQYIIEMKIWHGTEYNKRGEAQLMEYLDDYGLKKGYMLSFNFNKKKTVGVKEVILKNHVIIEAVV